MAFFFFDCIQQLKRLFSASLYIINSFVFKYKLQVSADSLYIKTKVFWFYSFQGSESNTLITHTVQKHFTRNLSRKKKICRNITDNLIKIIC